MTIPPFTGGTIGARTKLNAMRETVNNLGVIRGDEVFIVVRRMGAGVTVSLNIQQVLARIPRLPGGGGGVAAVRVAAAATGGFGKYTGFIQTSPAGPLSAIGNLVTADLGTDGDPCLIFNAAEDGLTTHALTEATQVQKIFLAQYLGPSSDEPSLPVYRINGFDRYQCEA